MLDVCRGHDINDPLSAPVSARFDDLPEAFLQDLRVGYSEDFGGAPVDLAIREVFRARVETLRPHVKECRPVDLNLGDMDRCFDILRAESFAVAFGAGVREDPDGFGPHIKENVALGQTMSLADRGWAHNEQTCILRRFNALMRDVDVIVLPTSPVSPFPWIQSHPTQIDGQDMDIYYRWLALCYRGSLSGSPAITLPCGRDAFGMPFGLQMLGAVQGDAQLLSAAKAVEDLFAAKAETARPLADIETLAPSEIDLRSIVTHPPDLTKPNDSNSHDLRTAV
jgi:Asp-tRNA(Asn)/Glu-tRNA(Gln) amidotransferase A subunit family amidase